MVFTILIILINSDNIKKESIQRVKFFKEGSDWFEFSFPATFNLPCLETKEEEIEWICVKKGHFVKCNSDENIKFFGTTVGWDFLLASDSAIVRCVKYIRSLGINCVRIHNPYIWDRKNRCFNKSLIKKLDFLTFTLRKHNIYYVFYSIISMYANYEKICGLDRFLFKGRVLLDDTLNKEIMIFWDSLMNHKNIYNNNKYLEDSALAFIIITNENSVDKLWYLENGKEVIEPYWEEYLKKNKIDYMPIPEENKGEDFERFLLFSAEMNTIYYKEMKSFLRNLGVRVPIGFTNNPYSFYTQKMIYELSDFIAVHNYGYYAYGKYGDVVRNESELKLINGNPRDFPTRMLSVNYFEKPVIIDEWNKGYPNDYRVEATILVPILAGMYDYDGIFYFSFFAHGDYVENPCKSQKFFQTSLEQPYSIQVLYFPSISFAFRNSYINKYTDSLIVIVNEEDAKYDNVYQYRYNPLPGKSGLNFYKNRVIIEFSNCSNRNIYLKDSDSKGVIQNSNLYWNYNMGQLSYTSKDFFAFAGKIDKSFSINGFEIFSNISNSYITVLPLDDKSIYRSHKILITAAKDAIYLGDRLFKVITPDPSFFYYFSSEDEQRNYKRFPCISKFEPISIEFSIPHIKDREYYLRPLLPNGKIIGEEKVEYFDDKMKINIDTYKYNTCYFLIEPYL